MALQNQIERSALLILAVIVVSSVFGLLAWGGIVLTRDEGQIAIVWLPNALLVAVLLRSKPSAAYAYLPAAFCANVAVNMIIGDAATRAIILALLNQFEILIIWLAMRKIGLPRPDMHNLRDLIIFVLVGGIIAPTASGFFAALFIASDTWSEMLSFWLQWSSTDGLGMLLLCPAVMVVIDSLQRRMKAPAKDSPAPRLSKKWEWIVIQAFILLSTIAIFAFINFPILFLIPPLVLLSAFRLGIWGTAVSVLLISIVVSFCVAFKLGPFHAVDISLTAKLLVVQVFLLSCFAVGMPVSATLSEKAKIRRELRDNQDLSNSMLQNMKEVIFRTNDRGEWQFLNPAWEKLTGLTVEESLGQHISNVILPDDLDALLDKLYPIRSGKIEQYNFEWVFLHKDGSKVDVELSLSRLVDDDGNYIGSIGNIRDISERKEMEVSLVSARRDAEKAANAKTRFLASMSHEIRTPMNGVLGFTQLLLDSELTGDQRKNSQIILDSGNAMMRLLNNILDISKVEAGQVQLSNEPMNLRKVLRDCVDLMVPSAEQKGLQISLHVDDTMPSQVVGDCHYLRQITLNLIGNAVKFTRHGQISVNMSSKISDDGQTLIAVAVEDTGVGIPPDRLSAIFDPFEQAEATTAQEFGGSGLGLTISQQLAAVMDGSIGVTSVEGQGTTFELQFPADIHVTNVVKEEQVQISARAVHATNIDEANDALPSHGYLLLVEDHDVNQMLITAMTDKLGYRTVLAVNGADAVAKVDAAIAAGNPFDLVLMDIQMPVMDGYEATKAIRTNGITAQQLPILAITANAYGEDVDRCLAAGMQGHIAKPVMISKLQSALNLWVGNENAGVKQPASPSLKNTMSKELQQKFLTRREELIQYLSDLIDTKSYTDAELSEAAEYLHKFAGTAAFFGEAELGIKARHAEVELAQWTTKDRVQHITKSLNDFLEAA